MSYQIDRIHAVVLGRKKDVSVSVIQFDCSTWINDYPNLTDWKIEATSPCGQPYEPSVTMNEGILSWIVTENETKCSGRGSYQIVAEGDGIKKVSAHPNFYVLSDMYSSPDTCCDCEDRPMTAEEATEEMTKMLEKAEAAATRAEEAVDKMEECDVCNGTAFLIFDGGDSDTNIDEEEGQ